MKFCNDTCKFLCVLVFFFPIFVFIQENFPVVVVCDPSGYAVLFFAWFYPQRSLQSLILLKGGERVRLVIYGHFGRTKSIDVPLEHLSFSRSRHSVGAHIPVKLKNRWFYYLMDRRGQFHNTDLFDFVVGLKRNLK